MAVVIVLLVLSFLVVIHELGHFLAARAVGITVEEFGIGYPPRALSFSKFFRRFNLTRFLKRNKSTGQSTEVTLNWIPFGGFVRMAGETPDIHTTVKPKPGDYLAASLPQRLLVVFAGVTVNFLFGIIAFTIVFGKTGIPQEISGARIGMIEPNSPAAQAGIPSGVEITGFAVNGERTETRSIEDVQVFVSSHRGQSVTLFTSGLCSQLECDTAGQSYDLTLRSEADTPEGQGSLGVGFESFIVLRYPWYEMPFRSVWHGLGQTYELSKLIVVALGNVAQQLTKGVVSSDVAGPVGIIYQAQKGQFFDQGFLSILTFAGVLSINLAVMNILPIPPLDGGRALLSVLELILGKKRSHLVEYYASYGGYAALILLIVLITFSDISRIVLGS